MSVVTAPAVTNVTAEQAFPPVSTEGCDACGVTQVGAYADVADGDVNQHLRPHVAQAWIRWIFPNGLSLTWCKHHGDKLANHPAIVTSNVTIVDESENINKAPSVSANKD